ncbi:MAG: 2-C-methyl-D-erythritol 2,4-cyclodiphosphate synthase [Acidobacteriota bacterium]|nr:2-C-methyl-D-erythritol 2,4-cyclodiphosphate synthase [Acidobacteriota bacterium]
MRIGFGNDIHRLGKGGSLILAGIVISTDVGAVGHSDADALFHAVTDAILGALAEGDIGTHFPPDDKSWQNADSSRFLKESIKLMKRRDYEVVNLDTTVSLEAIKLRPFIEQMRERLADFLETDISNVSIKAKTGEGVDAVGECRAIKAEACILLTRIPG